MENSTIPGYDQMPAAPPPPGVIPNFIDPPSQANTHRIFTYITLPPMILSVALRIYARVFRTREMGLDDCEISELSFGQRVPAHMLFKISAHFPQLVDR